MTTDHPGIVFRCFWTHEIPPWGRKRRRWAMLSKGFGEGIYPIGSMYAIYGIYANIWGILMVNVTIYSIHGSYGYWNTLQIHMWCSTWPHGFLQRFWSSELWTIHKAWTEIASPVASVHLGRSSAVHETQRPQRSQRPGEFLRVKKRQALPQAGSILMKDSHRQLPWWLMVINNG